MTEFCWRGTVRRQGLAVRCNGGLCEREAVLTSDAASWTLSVYVLMSVAVVWSTVDIVCGSGSGGLESM